MISKSKAMNLIKQLFKKKEGYKLSDFENAKTRGGYTHCIYYVQKTCSGVIYNAVGVVLFHERRIFVKWDEHGQAFVVRERDEKFDLIFKI